MGSDATPARPEHPGIDRLVAVMDRLRSPGGCPWDAEQTHESLLPYAVEEVYEVMEAVEAGDRAGIREELGDLLLQVVFHARIAQEHPDDPFGVDDVAADVAAKLRRRHPHVFGEERGADPSDAGDPPRPADPADGAAREGALDAEAVHRRWDALKQTEKERASVVDGIPPALPALARAQKVLGRVRRAGLEVELPPDPDDLGRRLLALVDEAQRAGVDAESALRGAVHDLESAVRRAEAR
ncbi:MazG family protein [Actinotalea sp. AC32]|nr:MazG family protein [Actinotalea sp. AC32]